MDALAQVIHKSLSGAAVALADAIGEDRLGDAAMAIKRATAPMRAVGKEAASATSTTDWTAP